jgi:hypothetical protein
MNTKINMNENMNNYAFGHECEDENDIGHEWHHACEEECGLLTPG